MRSLLYDLSDDVLDHIFGLKIKEVVRKDKRNHDKDALESRLGKASWSVGQDFSSHYRDLVDAVEMFNRLEFPDIEKPTIIDVGCGFGRLAVVVNIIRRWRGYKYHGIEINPDRVKEADAAMKLNPMKLNYENTSFHVGDVSDMLPNGDIYYMYDPVNEKTLKIVLNQIANYRDKYVYFRYGRGETHKIMTGHTGFAQITKELFRTRK